MDPTSGVIILGIGSTNKASIQLLGDDVSERLSYFAYDEGDECFIRV